MWVQAAKGERRVGMGMGMGRGTGTRRGNLHGGVLRRAPAGGDALSGVKLHRLNPKQDDFVASTARFSFYVGGLGAGKTYAGALRAILCRDNSSRGRSES